MSYAFTTEFLNSITEISKSDWNSLLNSDYPFLQHEFLFALEESGATTVESGWQPRHLLLKYQGTLIAALPLFAKTHSYGEYVFDFQWAEAYHRSGINYYPKLITAVPYTPATGKRLLITSVINEMPFKSSDVVNELLRALQAKMYQSKIESWHCLFPEAADHQVLLDSHLCRREGVQYHWFNRGYSRFDDFLQQCNKKHRNNIKRERRRIQEQNLSVRVLSGSQITQDEWQRFYYFYQTTYLKRSGHGGYLELTFFLKIGQLMPENIVLIIAEKDGEMLAGALFFKDRQNLYGRYWGCLSEFDSLHFELCYYQGIEYAIYHQLRKFDAGAQGEHKIQRGFEPIITHSHHILVNPQFALAIQDFCEREKLLIESHCQQLKEKLPFKACYSPNKRGVN